MTELAQFSAEFAGIGDLLERQAARYRRAHGLGQGGSMTTELARELLASIQCTLALSPEAHGSLDRRLSDGQAVLLAKLEAARKRLALAAATAPDWQSEGREQGRVYPLCLAGIGPYGAYLANGAEYRGRYGVSKEVLRQFHARRMELLWNAGADILLIETQPSLQEALLEADLAEQLGADYWISFTCGDDAHTWEGDDIRDCAKALSENHPHLKMIGVNCVAPHLVSGLIENLKAGCGLPIGVYPNSGETYDPITKTWSGTKDGVRFGDYAYRWMEEGASAVGGCCQTVASHIRQVTEARERFLKRG